MAEHCYCGLWATAPETLRAQGVPEGYCGLCSVCGAPGHTRAHPSAPTTDSWCDACYQQLLTARPLSDYLRWVVLALALLPLLAVLWSSLR